MRRGILWAVGADSCEVAVGRGASCLDDIGCRHRRAPVVIPKWSFCPPWNQHAPMSHCLTCPLPLLGCSEIQEREANR